MPGWDCEICPGLQYVVIDFLVADGSPQKAHLGFRVVVTPWDTVHSTNY